MEEIGRFSIAEIIRKLREAKGMTQEKFAEMIGISVSHLSKVESGNRIIGMRSFINILQKLELTHEEVIQSFSSSKSNCSHCCFYRATQGCSSGEIEMFFNTVVMLKENLRKSC